MKRIAKKYWFWIPMIVMIVGWAHLSGYIGYHSVQVGDQYVEKWSNYKNPFETPSTVTVTGVSNGYVEYYWSVPSCRWSKSESDFHFQFTKFK